MEISILEATISDAAEILALQKRAYLSEAAIYDDYHIPPLTQTQSEIEAEFNDNVFLKALSSDSMVGSVRARKIRENCEIGRLIVEPGCQGLGIGRRLMVAIEARFDFVDWFVLFTGHRSDRNLRLYEHIGYHRFRTEQIAPGLDFVHLRKANGQH